MEEKQSHDLKHSFDVFDWLMIGETKLGRRLQEDEECPGEEPTFEPTFDLKR